ncbi:hypothetical protein EDB84DRAFT_619475 [Lactarius hengduanensis]|nr:hypothetical protein EDB84DRAFT_619475 [Lactarius hengduanensis]
MTDFSSACILSFVLPSVLSSSRLVQGTRTLLFRPPATPSNCQGIGDEAPRFPTLISSLRAHSPVATSPRKREPPSPIKKHFVLQPNLCAVRQLSCFLATASHAPASFPPNAILNLNG